MSFPLGKIAEARDYVGDHDHGSATVTMASAKISIG